MQARAKALSTRLLLLLEIHDRRHARLRTLAERLDITVQSVSDYVKRLSNEGLVESAGGAWRPTKKGTMFLHDAMRELRAFLDHSMGSLRVIDTTWALADRRLRAEEPVGLVMRDGRLHATNASRAGSRGRTRTDAKLGQLVLVGDLQGLVELEASPITLIGHPEHPIGPSVTKGQRHVQRALKGRSRVLIATHDLTSLAWAWALGVEVDLEFAPLLAAREAALRGVPVLYLVPERQAARVEAELREANGVQPPPVKRLSL